MYEKRRTMWPGVYPGRAVLNRKKDARFYDSGIIVLAMNDENHMIFSTAETDVSFSFFFYDLDGKGDEIHFGDEETELNWQKVFLYFWDEDDKFLLYADKNLLAAGGCRACIGNETPSIRIEALTVASFLHAELLKKIYELEDVAKNRQDTDTLEEMSANGE